jgi:hypothetical protein
MSVEGQVADDVIAVTDKTFKALVMGVMFFFKVTVGDKIKDNMDRKRIFKEELLRATVAQRIAMLAGDPGNEELRKMIQTANAKDKGIYWENIPNMKWAEFEKEAAAYGIDYVKTDLSDSDDITQICVHEEDKAALEKISAKLGFSTSFTVDDLLSPEQIDAVIGKLDEKGVALADAETAKDEADEIAQKIVTGERNEDFLQGEEMGSPQKTETLSENSSIMSSEERVNPLLILREKAKEKEEVEALKLSVEKGWESLFEEPKKETKKVPESEAKGVAKKAAEIRKNSR